MVHNYIITTNSQFTAPPASETNSAASPTDEADDPPLSKRLKLLANYQAKSSTQHRPGTLHQLTKYLEMDLNEGDDDCLSFWKRNSVGLSQLFLPALRALSVPASSSAVERVFSQGGLILRPQRARMGDDLLSQLIFLKCNRNFNK